MNSRTPDNDTPDKFELEHLHRLEEIIQRGLENDVEATNALAEISDGRLYRGTHETFEDYLCDRWGLGCPRGEELIGADDPADAGDAGDAGTADEGVGSDAPATWPAEPSPSLRDLRWLLAQSGGTIADVVHRVETGGAGLDEEALAQLRVDARIVAEELAVLSLLIAEPTDWDAEFGLLLGGDIAPFEDDELD